MYAVVKTGGKQYRVSQGDRLKVESIAAQAGDEVHLDSVLIVGNGESVTVGAPLVANASVRARVLNHGRGVKLNVIKFRRRKHYRRQAGHRQGYTELEVTGINAG